MKIEKEGRILSVTKKAFNVVYKPKGYKIFNGKKSNVILNDLTVKELKEEVKHRGIEGYSNMKKEELVETLNR